MFYIYIYSYAHEDICGVSDLANAGVSVLVVTSFRPLPDPVSFCLRGFGTSKFCRGYSLTLWPNWSP